ncbi:hypothetical protein WJX77_008119 [Trebouxia sp. C0004]
MRPAENTSSRTEGKIDSKAVSHRSDFRLHSHLEYLVPCDPTHRRQVYSYWATLSAKQRTELLTVTKESIRSRVQQLSDAASAEGKKSEEQILLQLPEVHKSFESRHVVRKTQSHTSTAQWHWPSGYRVFTDVDQFRQECLGEELQKLVPIPKDINSNAAFIAMQKQIQRQLPQAAFDIHCLSQLQSPSCIQDGKLDLLALLTAAVLKEHNVLMQVIDRCMVHESDVYGSEEQRLSKDALCEEVLDKVLLHRSCLVRKLCQPSAYGSITDKDGDVCFMVDSSEDKVWLTDFSTNLAHWQENCRAGQAGAKLEGECVQETEPVLEAVYSMYSPDDIASQLQYQTKGAAAVEVAYSDLESVLKELQALHQQADAAHEQATSNTASQANINSFRRQQEHNAAIEKIHAVLPFLEAQLLDAAHDDPSRLIVPVVMLPLIQERLSDEAAQHAEHTAQKAFDDLLQDEASASAKAAAKAAAKQAKKLRQKSKRTPVIAQQAAHPLEPAQLMGNVASEAHAAAPTAILTIAATMAATIALTTGPASEQDASARAKQGTAARPKCTPLSIKNAAAATVTVSILGLDQPPVPCTDSMLTCCCQPAPVPSVHHQPACASTSCTGVTPQALTEQTCSLFLDSQRRAAVNLPAENKLLCCPITKVLVVEPVIAADGHTYEKSAMDLWLGQHATSPVTGAKLMHACLVPNRVLRSILANSAQ